MVRSLPCLLFLPDHRSSSTLIALARVEGLGSPTSRVPFSWRPANPSLLNWSANLCIVLYFDAEGLLDQSGFVVFVTPRLRKHDTLPISWSATLLSVPEKKVVNVSEQCSANVLSYALQRPLAQYGSLQLRLYHMHMHNHAIRGMLQRWRPAHVAASAGLSESQQSDSVCEASTFAPSSAYDVATVGDISPYTGYGKSQTVLPAGKRWGEALGNTMPRFVGSGSPAAFILQHMDTHACNDSSYLCVSRPISYFAQAPSDAYTLQAGDSLRSACIFDNSDAESGDIHFGMKAGDEMCTFFVYVSPVNGLEEFAPARDVAHAMHYPPKHGVYAYNATLDPEADERQGRPYMQFWANDCQASDHVTDVVCRNGSWSLEPVR